MSRSFAAVWVTAILVALSSAPALAQAAPYGSIGLYVDEARLSNTVTYTGPYTEFTMYVFVKPGPQGMSGFEFAIKYPSNVLARDVTSSPLLSVELGNLADGVSAAFIECRNDWVWTHQQLMYLRDTSPSRIEVVKHPLSDAYQATTCELGYPLESLLLSSSVCLNSTCEPDTTAPVITGAENTSYTAIKLTFSEPLVRQTAEDPSHYEVVDYDDPAVTPVISQTELLSGDRSVGLYLAEPLVLGRTYIVRAHSLYDLWGNEISPTSQTSFTPYERSPFMLKSISSESDSVLYVEFNRPPTPALAENAANYRVYRLPPIPGYPNHGLCSAQPSAAALVTQLRVRLTFVETKLPCETQLYLKVNNITDTEGNPLASPYDIMGFTVLDLTPPTIQSVSAIDRRTVTALFNEIVRDSTVNVPGNYVIWRQADTAATVPVIGALITAGKNGVKLRLGADLSPDATYVLRARDIMDVKGNRMPAWNTCGFIGSAPAQVPPYGSIGLYVDEARSANSVSYSGAYTEFTMYVFVKPGEQGLTGAEFAIKYPSNVLASNVTSSPLLSIEFGTLAAGMSAAFLECQNDWVWTHQQVMYLRNTSPSRIDVVKHPLAGAYEASTCELGYPLESLLLSSSVCLNSTFEPDTTAPLITGAENTSYTAIKLTFSEPLVRQAAEDPSNYEVVAYDKPAVTIVISQAGLLSGDRSVGLYLAEPLVFGRTYFVHIHGLCDLWGNEISPSCEIPLMAGEQGPPKLKGISSEGDSVLYVEFNRPLAPGPASNPANYRIYCQPIDPAHPENGLCSAQPSAAALVTQMRIRLLFTSSKPPIETQLYLKVSNVTDTAGNPLASPYDIMGFAVLDPFPPIIQSVKMNGRRTVTALFNEIVRDSTVNVPGNYVIWREADTTATVPVTGALITSGKNGVTLTLGADLTAEVPYVLRARGIMDRRGNRMPAWNACGFSGSDTWPPIPLSAVALSHTLIRITFDEELDPTSAETMSNYTVAYFDQQIHGPVFVPISDAALEAGGCAVRLVLGGALSYDVEHTVLMRHVKDIRGNAINTEYSFTVTYPDLLPPSITCVTGVSQHKINLIFDMKLKPAQAELALNYQIFESDDTTQAIPILGAALSSDQLRVTLALGEYLFAGRSYTISLSSIEDVKGHVVAPHTEFVFTFADTVPPSLLEACETAPTSVSAYFSEPLEPLTAENAAHYLITRGTETNPAASISGALLTGDSSVVRLTLGEALSAGVSYVLHVSGVSDRSLNPLPADSKTPITKSDSLPPTFAAYIETSTRVIVLFDEPVTELTAGNRANYRLISITPPCDTVMPAAVEYVASRLVPLTFSSALTPGHIYALHVSNVADFDGHPVAPGSEDRFVCTPYPNGGAIGLYADNHRYNNISDRWANEFTMYVWCKPGPYGLTEAQFSVIYPSGVYPGPVTPNSSVVEAWSGDLAGWSTATFAGCASDWVWICRQNCTVVNHAEATVDVASGVGSPLFTTCAEGHPTETASIICGLHLTDVAYVATLLKEFSASYRDGAVEISWQLSRLDEGATFTVSRAEPGSADYRELAGEIGRKDLAFSYLDTRVEPGKSYRYRVEYANGAAKSSLFETQPVAVPVLPMALGQNWPNPFNPITTITYYLPRASAVRLDVYDVSGRRIACLESGWKEGGKHSVGWDGRDESGRPAAAGIYLYRLTAGKETLSRKMILLR